MEGRSSSEHGQGAAGAGGAYRQNTFFDPSDFPLLRPGATAPISSPSSSAIGNPLPMSIVVGGQQQQPKVYAENFPALQGSRHAPSTTSTSATFSAQAMGVSNPFSQAVQYQTQQQKPMLEQRTSQLPRNQPSQLQSTQLQQKSAEQYGLMGLMGVIRMEDPDRGRLALGMDLTTLGLDLNSEECLYNAFAGPWGEDKSREPTQQFALPSYYPSTVPSMRADMLKDVSLDCLFAVFYSLVRDVLQLAAAVELTKRKWYFHIDLKIWFSSQPKAGGGASAIIFFDLGTWEKAFFNNSARFSTGFTPENGFLPEDTILHAWKQAQAAVKPAKAWS